MYDELKNSCAYRIEMVGPDVHVVHLVLRRAAFLRFFMEQNASVMSEMHRGDLNKLNFLFRDVDMVPLRGKDEKSRTADGQIWGKDKEDSQ